MALNYRTKKELKACVGKPLNYTETALCRDWYEYRDNGRFCGVGPSARERKWYAEITMENGLIKKVK